MLCFARPRVIGRDISILRRGHRDAQQSTMGASLEDQMFNMRFAAKQMQRTAKRCEKEEKEQLQAVKKAIEKGNQDMARIYATNAIRKKNEAVNYMRMAARFDVVASQLRKAVSQNAVTNVMAQAVQGLDAAFRAENMDQMTLMMGRFENQLGMMETQGAFMDDTMNAMGTLTTPTNEVDGLIQQVADEHGLALNSALQGQGVPTASPILSPRAAADQEEDLTARLNALRERSL